MVFSVATTKITITLPDEQRGQVRALVPSGRTKSVSAFAKHAIKIALFDAAGFREMLDQALQETGGPPTPEEREWVASVLSPKRPGSQPREQAA